MTRRKKQRKKPHKSPRTRVSSPSQSHLRRRHVAIAIGVVALVGITLWIVVPNTKRDDADPSIATNQPGVDSPAAETKSNGEAVTGTDRSGRQDTDHPSTKETNGGEVVAGTAVVQTLAKVEGLDPLDEGWVSESIHDQIHDQLARLKHWLRADGASAEQVAGILADDFHCENLRPAELSIAFESDGIVVRRASADISTKLSGDYAGPEGFAKAFALMLEPLAYGPNLDAEFKVVSTDLQNSEVETRMLVHIHGTDDQGTTVQINSIWQGHWTVSDGQPPLLRSVTTEASDFEHVVAHLPEGSLLSDCSLSVLNGIASYGQQLKYGVSHWVAQFDSSVGVTLHDSLGIAIADVNGDDLPDVYVCQSAGLANRLFLHQPDGTVVDASAGSGADFCDYSGQPLFVDLDNDGDQDLVVIVLPELVVLEGDGAGHFQVRDRQPISGNGVSLSAVDYDSDGLLDLYLCVRDADPSTVLAKGLLGSPIPYHDANNGGLNVMFHNEGSLKFADVTAEVGLDQNNSRFSQAVCWEDYDNDGDLDAYVANDFGRNNLYRNDFVSSGKFVDMAAAAGVEDMSAGMSVSWGDYDNDGWADLYVSNMFSSAGNRVTFQRQFKPGSERSTIDAFRRHARGNTLFRNRGDGTFEDVSDPAGVAMGRWAWASGFVDLNNDTWQDIVVANGFITGYQTDDL